MKRPRLTATEHAAELRLSIDDNDCVDFPSSNSSGFELASNGSDTASSVSDTAIEERGCSHLVLDMSAPTLFSDEELQFPEDLSSQRDSEPSALPVHELISSTRPLVEQAQLLLMNAMLFFRRLPKESIRALSAHISSSSTGVSSSVDSLVGGILQLGRRTVGQVFKKVKENSWRPCPPRSLTKTRTAMRSQELSGVGWKTTPGTSHAEAAPREEEHRNMQWGEWAQKLSTRKFAQEVEFLAARVMEQMDAADLNEPLGALGIPSDFNVMLDPVAIGSGMFPKTDSLLMVCLGVVSARNHCLYSPLYASPCMGLGDKSQAALVDLLLFCLREHPASFTVKVLKARLAAVGGDGQIVAGGPDARHRSSEAAESVWKLVFGKTELVCTFWDRFHLVDLAVMRAVASLALAGEVFAIALTLQQHFGVNEGRIILRSVAEILDEPHKVVKASGGNRKGVYSTTVPQNLISNYRHYVLGMFGKIAWKQAGHGKRSLTALLEVGKRLQDLLFVSFLAMFSDVLTQAIQPLVAKVQMAAEPWVHDDAKRKLMEDITDFRACVRKLRRINLIVALCAQHLMGEEWLNFFQASKNLTWGRRFPTFASAMGSLVARSCPTFQGCQVRVLPDTLAHGHVHVGAHCQCKAKAELAGAGVWPTREFPCSMRVTRIQLPKRRTKTGKVAKVISVKVPLWVASKSANEVIRSRPTWKTEDPLSVPPRTTKHKKGENLPKRLPGEVSCGMFRANIRTSRTNACAHSFLLKMGQPQVYSLSTKSWVPDLEAPVGRVWSGCCTCSWSSRCVLSPTISATYSEIDSACQAVDAFLCKVLAELTTAMGRVGTNDSMSALLGTASASWNWRLLAKELPGAQQEEAFLRTVRMLRPFLTNTLWPTGQHFSNVQHTWDSPDEELLSEYRLLLSRVRRRVSDSPQSYCKLQRLRVAPLRTFSLIHSFVVDVACKLGCEMKRAGKLRGSLQHRAATSHVASLISQFIGEFENRRLPMGDSWEVGPESIRPLLFQRRRRGRKATSALEVPGGHLQRGDLASYKGPSTTCPGQRKDRMVIILSTSLEVVSQLVSTAVDTDPFFSMGSMEDIGVCWRAVRVHHRCRLLCPPESACEKNGSYLHILAHDLQKLPPGSLADRLLLRQSQVYCVGSGRDELVVAAVSSMVQKALRRPLRQRFPESEVRFAVRCALASAVEGSSYMQYERLMACVFAERGLSAQPSAHVRRLQESLRHSGRTWQNFIGASSHEESIELLIPEEINLGQRSAVQQKRRARNATFKSRKLPLPVEEGIKRKLGADKAKTRKTKGIDLIPVDIKGQRLDARAAAPTAVNDNMIKWAKSKAGETWKAQRAKFLSFDISGSSSGSSSDN